MDTTQVVVNPKGKVTSTNPFGQFSDNVLVYNACGAPRKFDLLVSLDKSFDTNPHDNPGNAVFTYLTCGCIEPTPEAISQVIAGDGEPRGEALCIPDMTVADGETLLATVHMGIERGMAATSLPKPPAPFNFSTRLYAAGSGCKDAPAQGASATLAFTTK